MKPTLRWLVPLALLIGVAVFFLTRGNEAPQKGAGRPGAGQGQRPVAVRVARITTGDLSLLERYPGELRADAVDLAPSFSGRILEIGVHVGDRVKKGQVVARLDGAILKQQLREAEARIRGAAAATRRVEARLQATRAEWERKKPLAERQLVSAQELAEVEANVGALEAELASTGADAEQSKAHAQGLREQIAELSLVAPFDGVVASRLLEPGSTASSSTPIVRLVRGGPLEIRFRVPERDAAVVRKGLALEVETQATGETRFTGRVSRVAGEISRNDRSLLVEGLLEGEEEILKAGMYATVRLVRKRLEGVSLVPAEAILERGSSGKGLFVAGDGVAQWRQVQLLGESAGIAAVSGSGIEEGGLALIFGHDDLADGSPILVVDPPAEEGIADGAAG